jgi:hypothetical protein
MELKQNYKNLEIVDNAYSMHPIWLNMCMEESMKRIGLETLDCMIINNPFEVLTKHMNRDDIKTRIAKVFEFYE